MSKLSVVSLVFLCSGCATTGGGLQCPDQLYPLFVQARETVNNAMVKAGYEPLSYDADVEVETRVGTKEEGGRWFAWDKVRMEAGEWVYGWVGGYGVPGRMVIITGQNGLTTQRVMVHETAHVALFANGVSDVEHHAIMKRLGLY